MKPENVFLTRDRKLKLLDFGIARLAEIADAAMTRTRAGTLLGTPAFLPPEQARGEGEVGVQTDLWSVGATMFTLLSGRFVHEEADLAHQLLAVTTRTAPSLGQVAPHVPKTIVHLVDYALAFDARNRWPNATTMRQAIRLAYTDWARSPMPDALAPDLEDLSILHVAPSAPPPSRFPPDELRHVRRGPPR